MNWLTAESLKDILAAIRYFLGTLFSRPEDIKQNSMNEPTKYTEIVNVTPLQAPVEPPPAPKPKTVSLTAFCEAIRDYEGQPGDRNYRNNNPGNCRYSSVGYASMYGHVGKDAQNFAIFKDYATGFLYLKNLVLWKVRKNPNQTLYEFMQVYAPTSDGNNPKLYAQYLARRMGVTIDFPMKNIV